MNFISKIYSPGTLPPIGEVPHKFHAWTIRNDRLGSPEEAFKDEIVDTPELRDDEVLIAVISAGVNYNGIWAAKGEPKNVIETNGSYGDKKEDFHICGSEASGIVYAIGKNVKNVKIGDEVIVSASRYNKDCEYILSGGEPELSPSFHIWGYESNWGAFAQFCKAYDYQCTPRPANFTWDETASCIATGATVNRMLNHWEGNRIKQGDVVLIWGGSGGIGASAIQQVTAYGGIAIAVVSDDNKGEFCRSIGAKGYINRKKYDHWCNISELDDRGYKKWIVGASKFRNEMYSLIGERRNPSIVIEHPGAMTLSTSLFVCANGGMVVLCGATTGFKATVDLRHLWLYQKRIQGSHAGSSVDLENYMKLCSEKNIRPKISRVFPWEKLSEAHSEMSKGNTVFGKYVVRIVPDTEIPRR
jgi:crotonyl-CoA carboxylase/reductase